MKGILLRRFSYFDVIGLFLIVHWSDSIVLTLVLCVLLGLVSVFLEGACS